MNEVVQKFSENLADTLTLSASALPHDFNQERFVQNCVAFCNEHPELMKINQKAVIEGLLKGAFLGLDYFNKECYLIPYGNKVQFQTDYKGEIKFVKKYATRPILDIYAKLVREGDTFEEIITDGRQSLNFKPLPFNGGEVRGVFAVVLYQDGGMGYEVMTTEEINDVRNNYSKAVNSKAWKSSWGEMAKKTCLRRLTKTIDKSFENIEAMKAWDEGQDSNIVQKKETGEVMDVLTEVEEMKVVEIG